MFYTPGRMRLGAVIVYVEDVGRAVDFYERAFCARDPEGTLVEICSAW